MPDSIYTRKSLVNFLIDKEGRRPTKYTDKGGFSIGIGHYITPKEEKSGKIYGVDFRNGISNRQMDYIFNKDLEKKIDVVKETLPDFDSYPEHVQNNLVGSNFRGSFLQSPKTIALIKQKEYEKASKEFLNNKEYRNSPEIRGRMNEVSEAIRSLSNEPNDWEVIESPKNEQTDELTPEEEAELNRLRVMKKDNII